MGNNKGHETTIVLQLDRSRTERAFDRKESFWDNHEIERMLKLIDTHVGALKGLKEKGVDEKKGPLLSIGIFGSPGSGKTSLLRTFVERARGDNKVYSHIHSLPVIRPNTIAKDDHFLYAFLASALKEDRVRNENAGDQYQDSPVLSRIQQKFQEVSEYLQVINEAERSQEDDPLGRSLERLERHECGLLLIEKMYTFIDEMEKMMTGSKDDHAVVLLPVDDADMSMDILVSALDTCWRYLKHPRLIPVFTFTGRLAEELLRVHYERKLTLEGRSDSTGKLREAATSLMLTENMAIQYLGRLFPVRNRIRMGSAAARVLKAEYTSSKYKPPETKKSNNRQESNKTEKVLDLLETVSKLLFGHPDQFTPRIRAPLRMVTLRRQIQIVDAMQEAGIDKLDMKNITAESKAESKHEKSWAQLFDLATWALLNTHRDIMREIELNLDDLYTWTPMGLRLVVLHSILSLELKKRRKLLTKWRYRTEGRRTQMLSLLAANVFRPWMEGVEPTGDDLDEIYKPMKKENETGTEGENNFSFPVRKGIIWFLDLCIGFYLPQVLACNFPDNTIKNQKTDSSGSNQFITGIGWDFVSGPLHAVREALFNKDRFFSGMLFIDSSKFNELIKIEKDEEISKLHFLMYLWCFYGHDEGRPWAAVSFWRGLGLIGQLISMRAGIVDKTLKKDRHDKIISILNQHLEAACVIGRPPKIKTEEQYDGTFKFSEWKCDSGYKEKNEKETIMNHFASKLENWLDTQLPEKRHISPLYSKGNEKERWEACFIRRLHGESIISEFWRDLENVYFDIQPLYRMVKINNEKKTEITVDVEKVIKGWVSALIVYWKGDTSNGDNNSSRVQEVLKKCPILELFINANEGN
jgi:hypothetical protein